MLDRIVQQDPQALAALYRRYGKRVYSLAYRILNDESLAEEVCQDMFLRVWQRPHQFRAANGVLISWLLTIARNLSLDRRRREISRGSASVVFGMDAFAADGTTPDTIFMEADAAEAVRSALEALPGPQRKALELAYFDGLSHSELSKELGEPLGTVKTRVRLGLLKLKEILRQHRWTSRL